VGKAEDKRAAIIAQQAAREAAEPRIAKEPARKKRTNWAATGPIGRPGRGRPPSKPPEE
jgi:hypothetical protein